MSNVIEFKVNVTVGLERSLSVLVNRALRMLRPGEGPEGSEPVEDAPGCIPTGAAVPSAVPDAAPVVEPRDLAKAGERDIREAMDAARLRLMGTMDRAACADVEKWKRLNNEFLALARRLGNCKPTELRDKAAVEFVIDSHRIECGDDGTFYMKEPAEAPF